jgi:nitrogen fixation protein NifU and related proteins
MVMGKHIDEVKLMGTTQAASELGGLPPVKMHCSVLAINGIKAAIREFEKKIGRIEDEVRIITEKSLLNILKNVMHPKHGKNLVDNENIQRIRIDGQDIFIIITLEPDEEMFASNIHDEVMEHLEAMKCTHEIMVKIESKTGSFI